MKPYALILVAALVACSAPAQDTLVFRSALMIRSAPGFPDNIARIDPIESSIVEGTWRSPQAGDSLRFNDTLTAHWEAVSADPNGWYDGRQLRGAYVYATVNLGREGTYLLAGMANSMVYVNGVPRSGNPYGEADTYEAWETRFDYSLLPVELKAGKNEFLFHCSRGRFKARLIPVKQEVQFNLKDLTKPDLVRGRAVDAPTGVVIINASRKPLAGATLDLTLPGGLKAHDRVPLIQPMSVRKVPFTIRGKAPAGTGDIHGLLSLRAGRTVLDTGTIVYRIFDPAHARRETFISETDGSVQFYGILEPSTGVRPTALIFSLHGAGVDAYNQVSSYYPKPWALIASPTNRRPYGFNWEDWGRLDALEVFDRVNREFPIDESRVYLTGHSMGGHGTYHVGSLYPDKFAAIGPSAGWLSFWSYRVREGFTSPTPMRSMVMRAALPSFTETMAINYKRLGVYILHGDQDDNVFPRESRQMAKRLAEFHKDFIYDERPGVGHWWDLSDELGADCVDWPPMMDFFARHARPTAWRARTVDFATPRPGVSADCDWLRIEQQTKAAMLSSASLLWDPGIRRISGSTENIARLSFDLKPMGSPDTLRLVLDSCRVGPVATHGQARIAFEKIGDVWKPAGAPDPAAKGPRRDGVFKDLFRHRFILVYGTHGTAEENRWGFEKTRFDAERFWYQGNGDADVVADTALSPAAAKGRNVVLYGNAATNSAWKTYLGDSPVQVTANSVRVGNNEWTGNDLACLVIRPSKETDSTSVGAVAATGIRGMRLTDRFPYLLPGVAFPDLLVCRSSILTAGEEGIEMAGFFGNDWSIERGEFVKK
jgi:dienelactone hydrolase